MILRTLTTCGVLCVLFGLAPGSASAATLLTQVTSGQWTLITDGTSNTIQVSETTPIAVCVPIGTPTIADGTSNTLVLSEGAWIDITWTNRRTGIVDGTSNTIELGEGLQDLCYLGITDPTPRGSITDGSSNTIFFPEHPIDLRDSSFDICFANVPPSIPDGTSNTILFSECFRDVSVPVPEPGLLTALSPALLLTLARRRRWRR